MEENKLSLADTFNMRNLAVNEVQHLVGEIKNDLVDLRALATEQQAVGIAAKIDAILEKLS
ncbi:hypothetical protein EV683_12537 [Crenobacter luteus]|uniref:Uncharacterized protein n=1 Tax=Crenobacter luteus TaxID=1452487 RepID=A0A165EN42_9NEIS|nr:hypothetical protein [Crenobacter luteus]KZE26855.1 hypothetical protein AVW16_13915 [Crenobacter luteus]TCP10304.1 hypothetical protein EV683_12537 [Crenobacter luteus]